MIMLKLRCPYNPTIKCPWYNRSFGKCESCPVKKGSKNSTIGKLIDTLIEIIFKDPQVIFRDPPFPFI